MKTFLAASMVAAAMFLAPAVSGTDGAHAHHTKKDKAYWTRVWYKKQARKKYRKASARRSTKARSGRIRIVVDKSDQRMTVFQGGVALYNWPVSTGRKGHSTPTGTWSVKRMHREYYSRKYDNAPMPHSMFYHAGFAVHGTYQTKRLGRPASRGCVRLSPGNARTLFNMVSRYGGTVKVTY